MRQVSALLDKPASSLRVCCIASTTDNGIHNSTTQLHHVCLLFLYSLPATLVSCHAILRKIVFYFLSNIFIIVFSLLQLPLY